MTSPLLGGFYEAMRGPHVGCSKQRHNASVTGARMDGRALFLDTSDELLTCLAIWPERGLKTVARFSSQILSPRRSALKPLFS